MPKAGVEPARQIIQRDFKSLVSTNFTTRAIASDVKDPLKAIGPNAIKVQEISDIIAIRKDHTLKKLY